MTTRRPGDADDLRDPRFDAAWRALSRDEPPAALDDAIRAAARREAHAGPRPVDVPAAHVPSALRPQRWWWPLAAAATIGAVAIGLLQLATPEHVGAPAADKGVVSDIPIVPEQARRKAEAAREELPPPDSETAPKQVTDEGAARPAQPSAPAGTAGRAQSSAERSESTARTQRKDAASPVAPNARAPDTPTFAAAPPPASSPPSEKPSGAAEQKTRQAAANAAASAPAAEPFPADAAKRDAKETASPTSTSSKFEREGRSAGAASAKLVEAPAEQGQPQAGAPAPATQGPAPRAKALGGALAQDSLTTAPPPAAGTVAPAPPRAAPEPSSTPERAASTREAQFAKSSVVAQSVDARSEVRAKHPPLPVADWITLIRRLRDEGKPDEAVKELAAFRAAYPDHERLLPPDLRDWHPAR